MISTCAASGCGRSPASQFSRYCAAHKSALRRHGDADQRGVTKAELKPFRAIVEDRIARNPANPAWAKLEARWKALETAAAGVVAAYEHGRPSVSWDVAAAREVVRLYGQVEPHLVLVTVGAMVVMQDHSPRRFKSDRAFRAQVVRRVRGLTEASAVTYREVGTGRERRTYTDLSPRAAEVLGGWLLETLGIAGSHIARKEREERAERMAATRDLHADLEDLA